MREEYFLHKCKKKNPSSCSTKRRKTKQYPVKKKRKSNFESYSHRITIFVFNEKLLVLTFFFLENPVVFFFHTRLTFFFLNYFFLGNTGCKIEIENNVEKHFLEKSSSESDGADFVSPVEKVTFNFPPPDFLDLKLPSPSPRLLAENHPNVPPICTNVLSSVEEKLKSDSVFSSGQTVLSETCNLNRQTSSSSDVGSLPTPKPPEDLG